MRVVVCVFSLIGGLMVMRRGGVVMAALALLVLMGGGNALASEPPSELLDQCTQSDYFDYEDNPLNQAQDLLQTVVEEISAAIETATDDLFLAFINDAGYQDAVGAALILALIFFGVAFTFGFVNLTLLQGVMLLIKIGFVSWIASPSGMGLVNDYLERLFVDGGAWLINAMINIASDGVVGNPGISVSEPFMVLDEVIQVVFSPRMFVTLIALATTTGPFGAMVALVLGWSVLSVFLLLLKALRIYAVAIVMKTILIGLAPVFIPMLLFSRTKAFFMGWLNQLVNFMLQPVLLFAFIAFFASVLASAARDVIPPDDVHLCYTKTDTQAATPFDIHGWQFMCPDDNGNLEPYEGDWTWEGPIDCPNAPVFPMNHINVLVLLLLTHIMKQLADVALALASKISQGTFRLDNLPSSLNEWFGVSGGGGGLSAEELRRAQMQQRR